ALAHQHAIHRLSVHPNSFPVAQNRPQPPVTERRKLLDQLLDSRGKHLVDRKSTSVDLFRALPCHRTRHDQHLADPTLGDVRLLDHHSPDVVGSEGRRRSAVLRMSRSSTSSPTFCLSLLICSSLSASSSFGRDRSPFSAARKKRSFQSSISATVRPCLR